MGAAGGATAGLIGVGVIYAMGGWVCVDPLTCGSSLVIGAVTIGAIAGGVIGAAHGAKTA